MIINGRIKKSISSRYEQHKLIYGITSHANDSDFAVPDEGSVVSPTDGGVVVSFNPGVVYNFYNTLEPKHLTSFKRNYFFDSVYKGFLTNVITVNLSGIISSYFNSLGYYRFWLYLKDGIDLFSDGNLEANLELKAWADKANEDLLAHREGNYVLFTFEDSSGNVFGTSAKLYFNKGQAKYYTAYQMPCPMDDSTTVVKDGFTINEEVLLYVQNGEGVKIKLDYEAASKLADDKYVIEITSINELDLYKDYKSFNNDYFRIITSKDSGTK
jgi:hypothetical protein